MKGKLLESSDCEGDGDTHEPEKRRFTVDDLLKKSSKPSSMGIVKVRSLGNALEDFQLLRVLGNNETFDDLHGDSLKPSEHAFHQARFAMRYFIEFILYSLFRRARSIFLHLLFWWFFLFEYVGLLDAGFSWGFAGTIRSLAIEAICFPEEVGPCLVDLNRMRVCFPLVTIQNAIQYAIH